MRGAAGGVLAGVYIQRNLRHARNAVLPLDFTVGVVGKQRVTGVRGEA